MRRVVLSGLHGALLPIPAIAGVAEKPPAAAKVLDLFQRLKTAQQNGATAGRVSFQLSEQEVNEYPVYSQHAHPRPGLDSMTMKFFSGNYISTFTVMDFDAIERWKPGTIPMLLKPALNGKKSVWVDARFEASGGKTTFSIEKAYFNNIRLPAYVAQKAIEVVAARQPEHYDATKPVPLPFGLRSIWTTDQEVGGEN
ncbi:MAG: hypothetical protein ABI165_06665 [Bryobacteraceae bacterium]